MLKTILGRPKIKITGLYVKYYINQQNSLAQFESNCIETRVEIYGAEIFREFNKKTLISLTVQSYSLADNLTASNFLRTKSET